jgi:hypothetical protein
VSAVQGRDRNYVTGLQSAPRVAAAVVAARDQHFARLLARRQRAPVHALARPREAGRGRGRHRVERRLGFFEELERGPAQPPPQVRHALRRRHLV